jgi:hypothetical protein
MPTGVPVLTSFEKVAFSFDRRGVLPIREHAECQTPPFASKSFWKSGHSALVPA